MFSISKIFGKTNSPTQTEYICDFESDVEKLPTNKIVGTQDGNSISNECCAVGSTAFVIETSSVYMLGNDSLWHKI